MVKVLKTFLVFLIISAFAVSGVFIGTCVSPTFRENVEIFLKIDDENSIPVMKDKINKYEEQINGYEARIEALKEKVAQLEVDIEALQEEDSFLKEEITRLEARVKVLEAQVKNLEGNIDDLNAEIDAMNKAVDELWNIFNNYTIYDNAVNSGTEIPKLEMTESEKVILENKIEDLEETVQDLIENIEDLNNTIEDLNNQIENLESEKIEITNNKTQNDTAIIEKQEIINNNNVIINNYYSEKENIESIIDGNNAVIEELVQKQEDEIITPEEVVQLETLQLENANLTSQKYDIEANLSELERKVAELQAEVEVLQNNNAEYIRQIEEIDTQISLLEQQVASLNNETVQIQSNIDALNSKIDKFNSFIGKSTIVDSNGEIIETPEDEHVHIVSDIVVENYTETETQITYDNVIYCSTCSEEISRETIIEEKHVHTAGEVVHENYNETIVSETDKIITYEEVTYCTGCGEELSREQKSEEVHTHISNAWVVEEPIESETGFIINSVLLCSDCNEVIEEKQTVLSINEFGAIINTPEHNFPILEMYSKETVETYLKTNNIEYGYLTFESSEDNNLESTIFVRNNDKYYIIETFKESNNLFVEYMLGGCFSNTFEFGRDVISVVGHPNLAIFELRQRPEHKEDGYIVEFISNYNETEETITYDKVIYCYDCGQEVSRETITETKSTHNTTYSYAENYIETETGITYDKVISCTFCDEEISRESVTIDNLPESTEMISFTLFDETYEVPNGSTLKDFYYSNIAKLNEIGVFLVNEKYIIRDAYCILVKPDVEYCLATDEIIADANYNITYSLPDAVCNDLGFIRYYLDRNDFYAKKGTTWANVNSNFFGYLAIVGNYVFSYDFIDVFMYNGEFVNPSDEIVAGRYYETAIFNECESYEEIYEECDLITFNMYGIDYIWVNNSTFEDILTWYWYAEDFVITEDGFITDSSTGDYLTLNEEKVKVTDTIQDLAIYEFATI